MDPTTNNGNGFFMPVVPAGYGYGGGGYGGGFGSLFGGGDGWALLFILALCGGWGFGGGFGGFGGGLGMMSGMFGMAMLYPWLNNSQNINSGFRDQQISTQINGIQNAITSGFGDVQLGIAGVNQNICQTGNGIVNAVNNGFANAETAANARQIANMQQAFASQTAITGGQNAIQAQIAQNGYAQAAGTADVKYTIATEACNTRQTDTANTQAILNAINSGVQSLKDDACRREIESKNDRILDLERQLSMKDLAASQTAQNAFIAQTVNSAIDANYMRFKDCPVGTVPVFGNQPIFTCPQNANSCGCGGFNGNVNLY
jgi:hypothetical protein